MSTSPEFNPKRLTLARRRRGLTKIRLAQLLGVEVRSITAYENDEFRPDRERLHQLADRLRFPVQFCVFSLSIDMEQLDAFSMWHVDTPFVFLNTRKSCEHSRFDAAHELGHLVLHRHAGAKGQEGNHQGGYRDGLVRARRRAEPARFWSGAHVAVLIPAHACVI